MPPGIDILINKEELSLNNSPESVVISVVEDGLTVTVTDDRDRWLAENISINGHQIQEHSERPGLSEYQHYEETTGVVSELFTREIAYT